MPKAKVVEETDMKTVFKNIGKGAKEVLSSELSLLAAEAKHAGNLGAMLLPMLPVLKRVGVKAARSVKAAPVPYLWVAAGVAGYMAFKYYSRQKELKNKLSKG